MGVRYLPGTRPFARTLDRLNRVARSRLTTTKTRVGEFRVVVVTSPWSRFENEKGIRPGKV